MSRSPPKDGMPPASMLARVSAILEAFDADRPELSLAELATCTTIPKPSLYRICKELVERHLLERTPRGFRLGLRLFELGELVSEQRRVRDAAVPYLQELFEFTHEVVNLGVVVDAEVLYYVKIVGRKGLSLPTRIGGRWPAHASALGKVNLAFGPQHVLRRVMASGLESLTPHTITEPRRLLEQLKGVKRDRVAFEFEESALGVACVAAPVFANGELAAAISVSGPPMRLQPRRWASTVMRTADSISKRLAEDTPTAL
jgi:IclR family transcriptional regulator, acetate operon repressor